MKEELDKKKAMEDLSRWSKKLKQADDNLREVYMEMKEVFEA
jgi:hypothetical protein